MRHTFRCPMRWGDMDAYQHVNNVVYLAYLEEARVDMLFRAAREMGAAALSEGMLVARHEIDYRRPLVYHPAGVDIDVWVTDIGAARFNVAYEVRDDEAVFAQARTVLVPYDLENHRPRRLREEERKYLQLFLEPAPAPAR